MVTTSLDEKIEELTREAEHIAEMVVVLEASELTKPETLRFYLKNLREVCEELVTLEAHWSFDWSVIFRQILAAAREIAAVKKLVR